jgi:hypothetical protein
MANYPQSITLSNTAVILEITDDDIINTPVSNNSIAAGYIRQVGISAYWDIDKYVQYDPTGSYLFTQSSVTYAMVEADKILFIQDPLPSPP